MVKVADQDEQCEDDPWDTESGVDASVIARDDSFQDPRVDLVSLRGHQLTVGDGPPKTGKPVMLDGQFIGRVYKGYASIGLYGREAPMSWYRSDSNHGDKYDSPLNAARAMASDLILGRMSPGQSPLLEKWAAEDELGFRFQTMADFLDWAQRAGKRIRQPGVPLEFPGG